MNALRLISVSCLWALAGVAVVGSRAMPSVPFIQGAWQADAGPALPLVPAWRPTNRLRRPARPR
jgi:hypothetical protein